MAENSWHRYDMKKLRHCHPMYILPVNDDDDVVVVEFIQLCGRKTKQHNRQYNKRYKITYNTKITKIRKYDDHDDIKNGGITEQQHI